LYSEICNLTLLSFMVMALPYTIIKNYYKVNYF